MSLKQTQGRVKRELQNPQLSKAHGIHEVHMAWPSAYHQNSIVTNSLRRNHDHCTYMQ